MQEQYDLFTTNPGISGYRLDYLEIYNWGTFNGTVYRIAPEGNNSLLTGANASGKSTLIDALLTLLVPFKKDRFYNQSSGNEKKGDRTEETYVLGNYGNIQSDGESSITMQRLRDKNTYSIILASFKNNHDKIVTLFQVRWFVSGELKCVYGFSTAPLTINEDFQNFDGSKGEWRRTLEKKYNAGAQKKRIEFYDVIRDYRDRIISTLGLRSEKALTLFNQVVGVKVLNDLDDFIRKRNHRENGSLLHALMRCHGRFPQCAVCKGRHTLHIGRRIRGHQGVPLPAHIDCNLFLISVHADILLPKSAAVSEAPFSAR